VIIGVPKEIKNRENRVGLVPAGVKAFVAAGHTVRLQKDAGIGSGITNEAYIRAGATLVDKAEDIWASEMVIKVKEPLSNEYEFLRPGQIIYTYLHLAAEKKLTEILLEKKVTSIAYETIQEQDGSLPLLRPMSEVAGRMSVQIGAFYLQSSWGNENTGKGVLLGGVPGVMPGRIMVLGGGVAGANAAKVALGLGAIVTVVDLDPRRLEYLDHVFGGRLITLMSNITNIEETVAKSDLVIGAVLVPGAKAPKLVTRSMIKQMAPGSVVVDIAVDQGGCVETCKPTSHESPTFLTEGIVHYCVTNMPGAVSKTSTFALTNVTLRYALLIAEHGPESGAKKNPALRLGFNTYQGKLVHNQIAQAHGLRYEPLEI
jgi:alanine dehydrogenase